MDKLEEHIRKNREALDRYRPSSDIMKKIKRELKSERTIYSRWLSIAAMVIVILGTAVLLFRPESKMSENNKNISKYDRKANQNPQLKETEIYYNNLVNSLFIEANPLLTKYPEIKNELNTDISQLDSICSEIKKDLKDNIANQEVIEALIQNYRLKINLLEDMLLVLKENENSKEKSTSYEL